MQRMPKYKVCKRLGNDVYGKCLTQKFAVSEARAAKAKRGNRRRNVSDYGRQLQEKQKVRFAYGITERQLSRYAEHATGQPLPPAALHHMLESRLDNVVYRMGLASSRAGARQMVAHGHIAVNGTKIRIPSHQVREGDSVAVREGSRSTVLFKALTENAGDRPSAPEWITLGKDGLSAKITGMPMYKKDTATTFDLPAIFEFYSR